MQLFTFANCGAGYDAGLREFDLLGRDRNGLSRQRVLAIGSFGVLGVIRPNAQVCIEEVELLGNLIDETRIAVVVLGAIDAGVDPPASKRRRKNVLPRACGLSAHDACLRH
ncbi:TPA: hypothetical protein ONA77_001329 [Pseudomonas aeruginosa]|nr:hypothetical protein [Pseudomonas aeruginosa]HBO3327962.1 hypothetical protein [Pseudomonas aeruginosa]HCR1597337.1 hypothetical protein [Pseudomonas aeruginosa]